MTPTMELHGRRVAEWRVSLLDKRLKVNAGKSKVMVCISGCRNVVGYGKWPCGVYGKECRQTLLSVQYWKIDSQAGRRSGVRSDLSLMVYGFRCKRCDDTTNETEMAGSVPVYFPFLTSRIQLLGMKGQK